MKRRRDFRGPFGMITEAWNLVIIVVHLFNKYIQFASACADSDNAWMTSSCGENAEVGYEPLVNRMTDVPTTFSQMESLCFMIFSPTLFDSRRHSCCYRSSGSIKPRGSILFFKVIVN